MSASLSTIRLVDYASAMPQSTPRDAAATRRRLLRAARDEFAARGHAGARVDRIAAAAKANKSQIYYYFEDKDGLFDAVLEASTDEAVAAVPIDTDDLPGYAARLFDYHAGHPDLLRLVTWARLEGRTTPTAQARRRGSYRDRTSAIETAQTAGKITNELPASQILDLIESLAVGWTTTARGVLFDQGTLKRDRNTHRRAITNAVQRIVRPT
jgi:AcrR family transcriptional regulator